MFVVNPSCEAIILRLSDGNGWKIANLDFFVNAGFSLEFTSKWPTPVPELVAVIDIDRISISLPVGGGLSFSWSSEISAEVYSRIQSLQAIMVGVCSLLNLFANRVSLNQVFFLMRQQRIALGAAGLTFRPRAQKLDSRDFDDDTKRKMFSLVLSVIYSNFGDIFDDTLLHAGLALSDGINDGIKLLIESDKVLAMLPVAVLYALKYRSKSDESVRGGGVHVMTTDTASADRCMDLIKQICNEIGVTVARLGAYPTRGSQDDAHLADIVLGTLGEFVSAYSHHRNVGPEQDLHRSRGYLAIIISADRDLPSDSFIRRYPRAVQI